jgi:hypothetical protein
MALLFLTCMFFRSEVGGTFKLGPWVAGQGLLLHQNEQSVVSDVCINIIFHCINR